MLILFGRHPTPGRCKSRLARALNSDEAAAAIYDAIVRVVLLRTSRERDDRDTGGLQLKFSCASSDDVAACEALFATGGRWRACARNARDAAAIEVEAQTQVDDLGARIVEAFRREVDGADDARSSDSSIGRAVCVAGTDVPEFSRAHALEALALVEGASSADAPRVAFGPSRDGGFYCVAARATRANCDALERALAGVRWSASTTLEECARNCPRERFRRARDDAGIIRRRRRRRFGRPPRRASRRRRRARVPSRARRVRGNGANIREQPRGAGLRFSPSGDEV